MEAIEDVQTHQPKQENLEDEAGEKEYYTRVYTLCLMMGEVLQRLFPKLKSENSATNELDPSLAYLDQLVVAALIEDALEQLKEIKEPDKAEVEKIYQAIAISLPATKERKSKVEQTAALAAETLSVEQLKRRTIEFLHDIKHVGYLSRVYSSYLNIPEEATTGPSRVGIQKQRQDYLQFAAAEKAIEEMYKDYHPRPHFEAAAKAGLKKKKETVGAELAKMEEEILSESSQTRETLTMSVRMLELTVKDLLAKAESVHSESSLPQIIEYVNKIVDEARTILHVEWEAPTFPFETTETVPVSESTLVRIIQRNLLDNARKAYTLRPERLHKGVKIEMKRDENNVQIIISDYGPGFKVNREIPQNDTGDFMREKVGVEKLIPGWVDSQGKAAAESEGVGLKNMVQEIVARGGEFNIFNRYNSLDQIRENGVIDGVDIEIKLPIKKAE